MMWVVINHVIKFFIINIEKGDMKQSKSSWFLGICKICGYNVVVTQPDYDRYPYEDYWWYCSNKQCVNHKEGEHTQRKEVPNWVEV